MPKIDITKTELVWPGKYNEDGTLNEVPRVNLPFQVIETVNESRATRESKRGGVQGSLFDIYEGNEGDTFQEGWKNKLIWGDNLLVMGSLLEKFAGKIDLIYIDPPFATGANFSFTASIGSEGESIFKKQSLIEEKAYRDTWGDGEDSFIVMMHKRLDLMRNLLSEHGSIYVHCDWRVNSILRLILDEIFGSEKHRNQIIWHYQSGGRQERLFSRKHDNILLYTKTHNWVFDAEAVGIPRGEKKRNNMKRGQDPDGRKFWSIKSAGKIYKYYDDEKITPADVWTDISHLQQRDPQRVGYPTQKPEKLLERIIGASSSAGGLVADFFCGSGTTLAVAEKLGRRWIGCDLGRWAIHVTRKRLLGVGNCKPFDVLNLGKYERQYWQGMAFGEEENKSISERTLFEYLSFILKLYGAQSIAGMIHLHGKKGKAMVHIGSVDAPVTISEIDSATEECIHVKQRELHVLGWEWEMGLQDLVVQEAKNKGVRLVLKQIPREVMEQQAADKGDVRFFELAYLDAAIMRPRKLTAMVTLKDFVIPNGELIPNDVRIKVGKWSDYIDYWAVDWDFQNDTFMQGWVAYRTRKDRSLPLTSDPHTYTKRGKHRILVKVIDILGNDTSQVFEVEVK